MDLFSTEFMAFFPFHFFSIDNWFLAMDFIFYAMENGLNKFSEPKMNEKITLSIFGMENDLVLFLDLREHWTNHFIFLSKKCECRVPWDIDNNYCYYVQALHSATSFYSMVTFLFHLLAVVNTKEVHLYIRHIGCWQGHSKVYFKTKQRLYLATHPLLGAFLWYLRL